VRKIIVGRIPVIGEDMAVRIDTPGHQDTRDYASETSGAFTTRRQMSGGWEGRFVPRMRGTDSAGVGKGYRSSVSVIGLPGDAPATEAGRAPATGNRQPTTDYRLPTTDYRRLSTPLPAGCRSASAPRPWRAPRVWSA
jgi:hypothetical protein